jgi:hypothetical protein
MKKRESKIRSFSSFRESEDFDDVLFGFEELGLSEKTYSWSQILEVWGNLRWLKTIVEISIQKRAAQNRKQLSVKFDERQIKLEIEFEGRFEVEIDVDFLSEELENSLAVLPVDKTTGSEPRFTENHIIETLSHSDLEEQIQDAINDRQQKENSNWWVEIYNYKTGDPENDVIHNGPAEIDFHLEAELAVKKTEFNEIMMSEKMVKWLKKTLEKSTYT